MVARSDFNRPPRVRDPLPTDEIEIPSPPSPPSPPAPILWWTIALPIVGTIVWIVAGAVTGSSGLLVTSPIIFFSYAATLLTHFAQKKRYKETLQKQGQAYEAALLKMRGRLEDLHKRQQVIRYRVDPDLSEVMAWVEKRAPRLWERGPEDDDFLSLRMGVGTGRIQILGEHQQAIL